MMQFDNVLLEAMCVNPMVGRSTIYVSLACFNARILVYPLNRVTHNDPNNKHVKDQQEPSPTYYQLLPAKASITGTSRDGSRSRWVFEPTFGSKNLLEPKGVLRTTSVSEGFENYQTNSHGLRVPNHGGLTGNPAYREPRNGYCSIHYLRA